MFRFLFRLIGLLFLALGFIFLVYDGTKSIADQNLYVSSVGTIWANIHQNSLLLLQPAVERYVAPWLWQSVIQPYFLEQPIWVVLGVLGALLILLGRKKKKLIGYARGD
jgi:hypothetical protein